MLAEKMAQNMIVRGLKGTKFSPIEPSFTESMDDIGWYIHMPFCKKLCPYCSFRSIQYTPDRVDPYIQAVKREILLYREKLGHIRTGDIYFGGGTPSLTWKGVIEIADFMRSQFDVNGEIGLEAKPEDIDNSLCDGLKKAGITKVSLGVQSFDNEILSTMSRDYIADNVLDAINLLLDKGFYVSIDLLYGLPQQHITTLLDDLKKASQSQVHQISAYPFMLFPYTKWYQDIQKKETEPPSSRQEKKMFYMISDYLTAHGYEQTSCWDFANSAGHKIQYITCTRDENIGVGLSAYSKLGGLFYANTFYLKDYIERTGSALPVATGTVMSPYRVMRRWFMMALYRIRVEKSEFENRFGVSMKEAMGNFMTMLKLCNIIKEYPEYIQVTRQGMYWISLMTKTSMLSFPGRYYNECLHNPWPDSFEL
jgi:oxygen-independent coproporphyrinogen-3 oxidase